MRIFSNNFCEFWLILIISIVINNIVTMHNLMTAITNKLIAQTDKLYHLCVSVQVVLTCQSRIKNEYIQLGDN